MAGGREIKSKIKSVQNTRKVTRALEMVSASKIRKAQDRMKQSRPYARAMKQVIGHLARILSLSFRLFGNITGHELVLAILFMLAGAFFAPLPIMAMGIFVSFVQACVFFLLSTMYFAGSREEAH